MKHALPKTLTAAGAAVFLLTGCNLISGETDGGDSTGDGSDGGGDTPVYTEIASWDACEILDNLQPITDEMGILGYGSTSASGGEPGSSELGNTFDPDAIGCNSTINLGTFEGSPMTGEIEIKIVPTNSEDEATAAYEERVAAADSESSSGTDPQSQEFDDPWDQGTMISWTGESEQDYVQVIARDGQWVFHIDLYHSTDWGEYSTGEPALQFTPEERNQWFIDTYLPDVNQTINDQLAEVQ
ncbi:hypothetical protein [Glycomyces buryatensis]|uniref:Lipoprotein n=1 Tax=Glycomyces buryatensis TaxID=2570927 RepID=A0A4S8QH23_9ACTN|nr:hypothetical protein [Glycomyces buryatensis]THV42265.1 hypothetical protein FAB82_07240 [Glycomyces buryatensis]